MLISLLTLSLMMGLTGGPHCLMMCGPACSLLAQRKLHNAQSPSYFLFLLGRSLGYGAIGALVAISMQTLGWLSTQSSLFRPIWNMTHALALILGLFLLVFANQPLWLGDMAKRIWQKLENLMSRHSIFQNTWGVFFIGVLWSFIPCSLLYSVMMVAALSASALNGALIMLSFSLGGAIFMAFGSQVFIHLNTPKTEPMVASSSHDPILVNRWGNDKTQEVHFIPRGKKKPQLAHWGIRLAGLALAANSAWVMYADLVLNQAPWCLSTT
jgi:sulfite exporter TauE/SafE